MVILKSHIVIYLSVGCFYVRTLHIYDVFFDYDVFLIFYKKTLVDAYFMLWDASGHTPTENVMCLGFCIFVIFRTSKAKTFY